MNCENGRDTENQDREESKHKNPSIRTIGMDIVECALCSAQYALFKCTSNFDVTYSLSNAIFRRNMVFLLLLSFLSQTNFFLPDD